MATITDMHLLARITQIDGNGVFAQDVAVMSAEASALQLVLVADPVLMAIVRLSLSVSLSAVFLATLIGLPAGAMLALLRFPGRELINVVLNAMMGLPPVVVGLAVYLTLSRSGPLGGWGLLFTPAAMIILRRSW